MDFSLKTKKAMSKEETALLVDMIASHAILTKKETNATTNKMKEETWTSLTSTFNAKCGSIPRTKDQLKLKWDNLKKAARKRAQQIRMNNLKTGGGKGDFIPPDEILEKVSGLLGSTVTGFEVPFGGDGIGCESFVLDGDGVDVLLAGGKEVSTSNDARTNVPNDVDIITPTEGPQPKRVKVLDILCEDETGSSAEKSKYFFGAPMSKKLYATATTSKVASKGQEMSRLILHRVLGSPPARAVMMLSDILELQVQFNDVKLLQGEHKSPEFKKLNPMGTVPVLQDGEFVLSESHAIMKYLLSVYGGDKSESLYPSDVRRRALADQAMFFNAGVFFRALANVGQASFSGDITQPTSQHIKEIESSFSVVEAYVRDRPYIATDRLTIADLAAGSTATAIQVFHKLDADKFPRCADWVSRLEEEHVFKTIMTPGVAYFSKIMNKLWEHNKAKNNKK